MVALEVSPSTLRCDLEHMRNHLNAQIVFDRFAGGYRFDTNQPQLGWPVRIVGPVVLVYGNPCLLTMQHLLANLESGGILTPHIQPLMARLNALLGTTENTTEAIRRRVLVVGVGQRQFELDHFERVGPASLRRKQLHITYLSKGKAQYRRGPEDNDPSSKN